MFEQEKMFDLETPSMTKLDVSRCYVCNLESKFAGNFVKKYHYAHRKPSVKYAFGLYVDNVLAGVITYSTMFANIASAVCGDKYKNNLLELSRLFVFDWCGKNTESWFLSRTFLMLPKDILILLSYADSGMNHIGYIYQATNWIYTGMSKGSVEFEFNGDLISARNESFREKRNGNVSRLKPISEIQNQYPGIKSVKTNPKHRYVYFLGNKRQRRELLNSLLWDILPYPKS